MSSIKLAEKLALEEDKARKTASEMLKPMEGMTLGLADVSSLLGEIKGIGKEQLEKLEYIKNVTEPYTEHPYHSGVVNIAAATAVGNYPKLENIITSLQRPAREITLFNFGPGAIFFVFSKNGVDISGNETRLDSKMSYTMTRDDKYEIYYIHIRTDTNNSSYEIVGG